MILPHPAPQIRIGVTELALSIFFTFQIRAPTCISSTGCCVATLFLPSPRVAPYRLPHNANLIHSSNYVVAARILIAFPTRLKLHEAAPLAPTHIRGQHYASCPTRLRPMHFPPFSTRYLPWKCGITSPNTALMLESLAFIPQNL